MRLITKLHSDSELSLLADSKSNNIIHSYTRDFGITNIIMNLSDCVCVCVDLLES